METGWEKCLKWLRGGIVAPGRMLLISSELEHWICFPVRERIVIYYAQWLQWDRGLDIFNMSSTHEPEELRFGWKGLGVWLTVISNRQPRKGHDEREPTLQVPRSLQKTAACSEGCVEMGQTGGGLSGGEGELGKGRAAWGRNQNDETRALCKDWELVEGMASGLDRAGVKTEQLSVVACCS